MQSETISSTYALAFTLWAFFFQIVLIGFFALRRWNFEQALKIGPMVYSLGLPAGILSLAIILDGGTMSFWLGGFLCLAWSMFGYFIEYLLNIRWRSPFLWRVTLPYVALYLGTIMFYWWPLGFLNKSLWMLYALLFVISTALNITSHQKSAGPSHP